jgi:hypothetical protein
MWLVAAAALVMSEIPYDGIDQDGDGADLMDLDSDGFVGRLAFGRDCNDRNPSVRPGVSDPKGDGIDQDCDGGDGVCVGFYQHPTGEVTVFRPVLGDIRSCEDEVCQSKGPHRVEYECYDAFPHQGDLGREAAPDAKGGRGKPWVSLYDGLYVGGELNEAAETSQ